MEFFCIYIVLSIFSLAFGSPHVSQYEIKDGKKQEGSFDEKLLLLHNFGSLEKLLSGQKGFGSRLTTFTWKDCGGASDTVKVLGLGLTPSPLHFPGPLSVAAKFNIAQNLEKPLSASLTIKKKVLGTFIEIPCIDNFGSCQYDDVCGYLEQIGNNCPKQLTDIGINCKCPIKANNYDLTKTEFDVNASVIPTGEYEIEAKIYQGSTEAGCLQIEFEIE